MARVKRAVNAHKKRRVILERAEGYRGQRSRLYRKAKEQVTHSLVYAYRDRRPKKGDFRRLWIQRINAASRANGLTYNRLDPGPRPCRHRGRPSHPRRPRGQRARHVRGARRDRQGGAAGRHVGSEDRRVSSDFASNGPTPSWCRAAAASRPVAGPPIDLRHARESAFAPGARRREARQARPRVPRPGCSCSRAPRRSPRRSRSGPSSSSSCSRRRPRSSGTRRSPQAAADADVEIEFVTEQVLDAMADTVTPQGFVAVCRQFPTAVKDIFAASAEARRDPRRGARSGQRGHDHARGRCRGRRRRDLHRAQRRPLQPEGRPLDDRIDLPPAGRGRRRARRRARASPRRRPARCSPPTSRATTCSPPAADGVLAAPTAWLFGNEARGLPDEQLALADRAVTVPIYGHAESMNLATAASVCLYESAFAQRSAHHS